MTDYLYRVGITAYPEGACVLIQVFKPQSEEWYWVPVSGWRPLGRTPSRQYENTIGGHVFTWPSTKTCYRTVAAARRRARPLDAFGATVVIDRSAGIVWPDAKAAASEIRNSIEVPA